MPDSYFDDQAAHDAAQRARVKKNVAGCVGCALMVVIPVVAFLLGLGLAGVL